MVENCKIQWRSDSSINDAMQIMIYLRNKRVFIPRNRFVLVLYIHAYMKMGDAFHFPLPSFNARLKKKKPTPAPLRTLGTVTGENKKNSDWIFCVNSRKIWNLDIYSLEDPHFYSSRISKIQERWKTRPRLRRCWSLQNQHIRTVSPSINERDCALASETRLRDDTGVHCHGASTKTSGWFWQ